MHWFTAFVLYVMVWWTVLFAVLPFGTQPQQEADPVTGWRGTPTRPMMGKKILATTLASIVIWGGIMLIIQSNLISFRPAG